MWNMWVVLSGALDGVVCWCVGEGREASLCGVVGRERERCR